MGVSNTVKRTSGKGVSINTVSTSLFVLIADKVAIFGYNTVVLITFTTVLRYNIIIQLQYITSNQMIRISKLKLTSVTFIKYSSSDISSEG